MGWQRVRYNLVTEQQQQTNLISYLLEWPSSKRQEIINAGMDMEEKELLFTSGGNVDCCKRYDKQYGGSSKS